jgi:MSHA biogenesis protein MshI
MAPQGDRVHVVNLVREEGRAPTLRWACTESWLHPAEVLRALRRTRSLHRSRTVAVLQHGQYQVLVLDAPEVPREEWRDAIRWRLKDMVDFAVDSAGIDMLDIAADTDKRRRPTVMAVAAPRSVLAPLADVGADGGLPWQAIDVPEAALRNLCVLCAGPDRAEALLHIGIAFSTLVITAGGELLATRDIELSLARLTDRDEAARRATYERAGLEIQRTLDNIERQFAQANLARLQIAPGPPLLGFIEYLRGLVYVNVAEFELGAVLDLSAVPELVDPAEQAAYLPAIGAALR